MPIACETSGAPATLKLTVTGVWPSIEEVGRLRRELIDAGRLNETTRALFDITNVESIPDYETARPIIAAAMKDNGWPLQRAYLVASSVQYGFVRQLQALAPPSIQLEIFFKETDAMRWLRRSDPV